MNDELITKNMKLVYHIIRKDYPQYFHDEDVISAGMLGLVEAANRYDQTKGRFSSFASHRIIGAIKDELFNRERNKAVSLDAMLENQRDKW